MTTWRFVAFDALSGERLMVLPVTSARLTDELSAFGSWSASLSLDGRPSGEAVVNIDGTPTTFSTARITDVRNATRRGRSVVMAERDGVPVGGGFVWARRYDASSRTLQVAGGGLGSYFEAWSVLEQIAPGNIDQLAVFRALVDNVQNRPSGDVGIVCGSELSGRLRDQVYERYSGNTIGELMLELSQLRDGFDFDFRFEYDAGDLVRRCRLWYPRRGRTVNQTGLKFRAPGNAELYEMDEPAELAVMVTMLGEGDGQDMVTTTASRTDLLAAGWPGYHVTRARKNIRRAGTLADWAEAEADRLSGVDGERFTVQVDPTSRSAPFGSWDLGDDATLVVVDDPWYPARDDGSPGLTQVRRVVSHDWSIDASGEQLVVSLERPVVE